MDRLKTISKYRFFKMIINIDVILCNPIRDFTDRDKYYFPIYKLEYNCIKKNKCIYIFSA